LSELQRCTSFFSKYPVMDIRPLLTECVSLVLYATIVYSHNTMCRSFILDETANNLKLTVQLFYVVKRNNASDCRTILNCQVMNYWTNGLSNGLGLGLGVPCNPLVKLSAELLSAILF